MKRVMTMTVVRGNGECEAVVNGVVSAELRRLQAIAKEEMDKERQSLKAQIAKAKSTERRHNRLLARNINALETRIKSAENQSLLKTRIEQFFGMFAALYDFITGRRY